ncbi:hypothetical protein SSX86_024785 [Deinandra increscens subsp. villosa]|uniref:Uncharacterized protein n=1 Tax=Deinandra increscens subsp. villosa TaxID=3103831 RepID=A0AAP0CBV7_9ASTR
MLHGRPVNHLSVSIQGNQFHSLPESRNKCDKLKEHGASVGESFAAVTKKCKYTIGMLSDPAAALSICDAVVIARLLNATLSAQFKSFAQFCRYVMLWFLKFSQPQAAKESGP